MTATVTRGVFGELVDGTPIEVVTLVNGRGIAARVLTWGATLQGLDVPDRQGALADVVLGYATIEDYVRKPQFFGSTVGRYANRIAQGRFSIDGKAYQLALTDGPNTLHGGVRGFDKRVWTVASTSGNGEPASVTLRRLSPDGEEGFPGALAVAVTYTLDEDDSLTLHTVATTDRPTVLNLSNHTYFNLAGEASGRSALDHILTIHADSVTPVDATLIPTGEIRPVDDTPFDFRQPVAIVARVRDGGSEQIVLARGYDFNYVLRDGVTAAPRPAVRVEDPSSGRILAISTTEPGVQFYSGNFLDATVVGKAGHVYRQGDGVAFETQHFPDSPNHPHFPTTRLDPGQDFQSTTIWQFSVDPA